MTLPPDAATPPPSRSKQYSRDQCFINNRAAIELSYYVDNDFSVNATPTAFNCCPLRVNVIHKNERGLSKTLYESFVRLHRVKHFNSDKVILNDRISSSSSSSHDRLAYGDVVYISCGSGHVLRGQSFVRKAKWDKKNHINNVVEYDRRVRRDPKCHFKITGSHHPGQILNSNSSFQLESVHWKNCQLRTRRNSTTGNKEKDQFVISKSKSSLNALRFVASQLAVQPPLGVQYQSQRCSHGYSKVAHRLACSSYLNQSSHDSSSIGSEERKTGGKRCTDVVIR